MSAAMSDFGKAVTGPAPTPDVSKMCNIGAGRREYDELTRVDRARETARLVDLTGSALFYCADGSLALSVPVEMALGHVEDSELREAVLALRFYAQGILRALVTLPRGEVATWCRAQRFLDVPGEVIELGPDWSIRGKARAAVGYDVSQDLAADEAFAAGGAVSECPGQHLDDGAHAMKERGLLHGEPSTVHPDPLVPRMDAPPP